MKRLYVLGLCATLVVGCNTSIPKTPQQSMVAARATFLATGALFQAYATQPFCGAEKAPEPPFCADPQIVIRGKSYSMNAQLALDAADAVIKAGGIADMRVIDAANNEFNDLVTDARKMR